MVEKVSEVSMSVAMTGDSTPDDNALLKYIAKKNKKDVGDDNIELASMLPPGVLFRLTIPLAQGGGLKKSEKQAAKEVAATSLGLTADLGQTKKGDELRRQVALAVAGQMATPNAVKNSNIIQQREVIGPLSNDAATKLHQSATAQNPQAVSVIHPLIATTLTLEAEAGRQQKPLRLKEDSGEARPLWQLAKLSDNVVPKLGETAAQGSTQSSNRPATLQQLKTQVGSPGGGKGGNEVQTLEVHYQFQRWSGDHSVKISVPADARREGNVTLLPSDARAAEMLLRNMGHLTGLSPDIIRPQQERDEQQQQRRQQQQDEDQE